MAMRLFAVLRTIVVSIIFPSIWTWFVPRWVTGNGAFDNPRPLGWIVIALGVSIAPRHHRPLSMGPQSDVRRPRRPSAWGSDHLSAADDHHAGNDRHSVAGHDDLHHHLRRTDAALEVRRRLRRVLPQRAPLDSAAAAV